MDVLALGAARGGNDQSHQPPVVGAAEQLGVAVGVLQLEAQSGQPPLGTGDGAGLGDDDVVDHHGELGERHLDVDDPAGAAGDGLGAVVGADGQLAADEALEAVLELEHVGAPVGSRANAPRDGERLHAGVLGPADTHDDLGRVTALAGDVDLVVADAGEYGLGVGAGDLDGLLDVEVHALRDVVDDGAGEAEALLLVEVRDRGEDDQRGGRVDRRGRGGLGTGEHSGSGGRANGRTVDGERHAAEVGERELGARGHGSTPSGRILADEMGGWKYTHKQIYGHISTHYLVNRER